MLSGCQRYKIAGVIPLSVMSRQNVMPMESFSLIRPISNGLIVKDKFKVSATVMVVRYPAIRKAFVETLVRYGDHL